MVVFLVVTTGMSALASSRKGQGCLEYSINNKLHQLFTIKKKLTIENSKQKCSASIVCHINILNYTMKYKNDMEYLKIRKKLNKQNKS